MLNQKHELLLSELCIFLSLENMVFRNIQYGHYMRDNEKIYDTYARYENSGQTNTHFRTKGEIDAYRIIDDIMEIYEVKGDERSNNHGKNQLRRSERYFDNIEGFEDYKKKKYLIYYDKNNKVKFKLVE